MTGTITPIGIGTATLYPRLATAGTGLDTLVDPGDTNPPIVFEPPSALSAGDLEVWLITSGGANWGGCQVWISSATNTLSVDLSQSLGQMLSGTTADADNFVTLCYCDGELVSYRTATLTAAHQYDLTYLRRGVYGTPIGGHSSGTNFARFGPNDPSL